jgi:hypothetical protein
MPLTHGMLYDEGGSGGKTEMSSTDSETADRREHIKMKRIVRHEANERQEMGGQRDEAI